MRRTLAEDIVRGKKAIALGRQRGMDTTEWEARLADLELQALLAWSAELAEQDINLAHPISYAEAPLRQVITQRVSWYAAHYLKTISLARTKQRTGSWHPWTPEWWKEREEESIEALKALRKALAERKGTSEENQS